MRNAVEQGLLVKGGGHAMAAGITVERGKLGALRAFFEENASDMVGQLRGNASLAIDGALSAAGATVPLYETMEKAGPYGSGHPQPVLVLPHHRLVDARMVGTAHVKATLAGADGKRINAIAFRAVGSPLGDFLFNQLGQSMHVAGNLALNHWNGSTTTQFRILDAARAVSESSFFVRIGHFSYRFLFHIYITYVLVLFSVESFEHA